MDVAAALEPFDLKNQLSSNRTQGVPNMIALVKQHAARLAAASLARLVGAALVAHRRALPASRWRLQLGRFERSPDRARGRSRS